MLVRGFVQSPLPPLRKGVDRVAQAFGDEVVGVDVENGYLSPLFALEMLLAVAGYKDTVVGVASYIGTHSAILCQEGYVAKCVVVAFACRADDGYVATALFEEEFYCLCLVVGLLVGRVVDDMGKTSAILLAERVSVANYSIGGVSLSYVVVGATITTYDISALQKYLQRQLRRWVIAIGKNYSIYFLLFKHFARQ